MLTGSAGFHGHVAGCYENEDGHIIFDLTVADGNVFFFFPPETEKPSAAQKRNQLKSPTTRWVFDPKAPSGTRVTPAETFDTNGEFSRIDDRWVTKKYNHFWQARVDATRDYVGFLCTLSPPFTSELPMRNLVSVISGILTSRYRFCVLTSNQDFAKCGPPAGGLFNSIGHYTWDGRVQDTYFHSPTTTFQEPTFIPKEGGGEGEGWIIALLNHLDVLRNDIVILDAQHLAKGPVATVHLPLKLKLGLHGNFVAKKEIDAWSDRRGKSGDLGPVKIAEKPLLWQERVRNGHLNNGGEIDIASSNGTHDNGVV